VAVDCLEYVLRDGYSAPPLGDFRKIVPEESPSLRLGGTLSFSPELRLSDPSSSYFLVGSTPPPVP